MIVWGGINAGVETNTGAAYDPGTNTWTPLSTTLAPPARSQHSAVWTGSMMVVWGGQAGTAYLSTGGIYDPAQDCWQATATSAAPEGRTLHTAVWSGSEMIIWGGMNAGSVLLNSGGRERMYYPIFLPIATR